jgi:putative transposase
VRNHGYPSKPFESIEAARRWAHRFVQWHNNEHRHSAIRYVTPNQRHVGAEHGLLKRRESVYAAASRRNPARWSGKTRNWNPVTEVWLNPPKNHQTDKEQNSQAA